MLPSVPAQKSTLPQLVLFQNRFFFFVTVHLYWYSTMLIIVLILSSAKMISVNIFKRFKWCFSQKSCTLDSDREEAIFVFALGSFRPQIILDFSSMKRTSITEKKDKYTYPEDPMKRKWLQNLLQPLDFSRDLTKNETKKNNYFRYNSL